MALCLPHSTMVTSITTMDIMGSLPILHPLVLVHLMDMDRVHPLAMVPIRLLDMALNAVLARIRDMVMGLLMDTDHQVTVLVTMAGEPILLWILKETSLNKAPQISVVLFHGFLFIQIINNNNLISLQVSIGLLLKSMISLQWFHLTNTVVVATHGDRRLLHRQESIAEYRIVDINTIGNNKLVN